MLYIDLEKYLVFLRKYASQQACGKGRALLEVLGLSGAQIANCYGKHPQNEEESVQEGLQAWIGGGSNTTWGDLLEAMETAGIAVQQCNGLKKELYGRAGVYISTLCVLCCAVLCVHVCVYAWVGEYGCVGVCVCVGCIHVCMKYICACVCQHHGRTLLQCRATYI